MASATDSGVIPMKVLSNDIQVVYTGAELQHISSITYTLSLLWQLSKSLWSIVHRQIREYGSFHCIIKSYESQFKSLEDLLFATRFLPAGRAAETEERRDGKSQKAMQEVERVGWMKADRRWSRKLHQDEKWQALTNHCSDDCCGSDGSEIIKIWLNLVKYKVACESIPNAATRCNRFEHTVIRTWSSLSVMCLQQRYLGRDNNTLA